MALHRHRLRTQTGAEDLRYLAREGHTDPQGGRGAGDPAGEAGGALANNESAVRELGDGILKKIAVEITEKLRNSTSVDWQVRESVRAKLRNLVRRTLRKWKYPPDRQEDAVELVLKQAEVLCAGWA